jgi:O-antigen/teichoic acid export membrane protein
MSIHLRVERPVVRVREAVRDAGEVRPLSMRSNFAWTLAGSGVYGASQWGMLIVLAKLVSGEMVGRFALAFAICAPVFMFTNLQLRNVQATDARHEYRFSDYVALRLLGSGAALAIIAAIAFAAGYRLEAALVVLVIGLAKAVESISDVVYGRLQKSERLDHVARSMMLRGPAALAALIAMIVWTQNLALAVGGILVAWLGVLVIHDLPTVRGVIASESPSNERGEDRATRRLSLSAMGRLAWLSLPLGVVGLLDSLNVNVPRYVVERALGEAALGHFAAMAAVVVAGNMVVGALAHSAAPRLSRHYVTDIAEFKRLVRRLVQFGVMLGVAMLVISVLFGRTLLTVLYTPEYAAHVEVFSWLMVAAGLGFVARFLVWSMTAARCFRAQAPLYAAALLILGGLCFWLVPAHGLLGAAWAICLGMMALLVGAVVVNVRAVKAQARVLEEQEVRASTPRGVSEIDVG